MVEVSTTIQCEVREGRGKEASHKLRAAGRIPAVAYGPGSEPRYLSLDPHAFGLQRKRFGSSYTQRAGGPYIAVNVLKIVKTW